MNKRSLISVIVAIAFISNFSTIAFAEPNTSTTQTIQDNKVKYEQLDDETLRINSEITELNNDIESINLQLEKNNSEIKNTEIEIENINKKIEDAKIEIEKRETTMDKRLRAMYKTNISTDMIAYLITSENIFDFFYRIDAMKKLISIDKEIVDEINDKKNTLLEDSQVVEDKKESLNVLKLSIENDLKEVNKKKEEQEIILADLNSRKDEIMAIIQANEVSLLSYSISVINSASPSISELKDALTNLNYMFPQLNSTYAINLAEEGISSANNKITTIEASYTEENINSTVPTNTSGTYLSTFSMTATAYTGGTYTAMGLKPVRDPNGLSSVAVDPNVIPLGSKVYVEGYGYAIASDTGGAIKGNKIDLYMNSVQECFSFGRRSVTVHLIAYPNQW
ncbi:3D domain-containing protein [Clostridium sp. AL.422]|uniref:3D domain-containing protein n=1 Tax=Clostridium TaxID=1485 RepID=UPI00293DD41A|nr:MULTISPECIES: 3D domain-containing protein [unclassified Clostridium]MDV4152389.1 3D domain-containing protein [Clostridium sp. AL.422]